MIGTISLIYSDSGRRYTDDDIPWAQDLAERAALAIDNARLYKQLGERQRQLQELVGKLLVAQEEERRRVAYEVHDELAQIAASTHQHLQAFARAHRPRSPEARKQLDRAMELAQRTVREARRIVGNLRPIVLDDFGLTAGIRLQFEAVEQEGWEVSLQDALGGERLPSVIETALYRIAQEALTNVRKHARTSKVTVRLERRGNLIQLEVQDWGQGFEPEVVAQEGGAGERVGLAGMRERIVLLGGRFTVESQPGVGTRVVAEVPLPGDGGD